MKDKESNLRSNGLRNLIVLHWKHTHCEKIILNFTTNSILKLFNKYHFLSQDFTFFHYLTFTNESQINWEAEIKKLAYISWDVLKLLGIDLGTIGHKNFRQIPRFYTVNEAHYIG